MSPACCEWGLHDFTKWQDEPTLLKTFARALDDPKQETMNTGQYLVQSRVCNLCGMKKYRREKI